VRDPGVRHVTVTRVQMTRDLQHARVYYTVPGESVAATRDAARALRRARPFLKRRLGRLGLRHVPDLVFVYDDSMEKQDRVARLLDKIHAEETSTDDHEQHADDI
jgi:ribosome-binding factor A